MSSSWGTHQFSPKSECVHKGTQMIPDRGTLPVVPSHVGIRQLRGDVAAAVRRAGAGEHIVVTVGGRPVASLGPLGAAEGQVRLADLVARGQVVAPRRTGPWTPPSPVPVWQGTRLDRLLREIR